MLEDLFNLVSAAVPAPVAARRPLRLDDFAADGCVLSHGASAAARDLGGPVTLSRSR